MLFATAALALQLELVRHSLTGTHCRYRAADGTVINLECGSHAAALVEKSATAPHSARVFEANPVEKLNAPSLQDQNNSSAAVPDVAYSIVDLEVNPSGPLGGPYCRIVDVQPPFVTPIDSSASLLLDRSQPGFEDVNAYFHVDRSQRYLQSLGYIGARGIAQYPVPVDTHAANGSDTSFFVPSLEIGRGMLIFGDGGTDDAEDSDLVVHEYAHAIHEWISPGTFLGPFASEGRAISEGFADYWGFSAAYSYNVQSGRDPFCFADWDARCGSDASSENCAYPPGADCLRRLDSAKTVADFDHNDSNGTQYINGEIWSSALREIFMTAGKRTTDTIVIESLFGAPPDPSFAGMARRMFAVDRSLYGGQNFGAICNAMLHRGIFTDCSDLPRGELTIFQSRDRGIAIPDNDTNGVTLSTFVTDSRPIDKLFVQVDVAHPNRGDLQISLIAPDGTTILLKDQSNDRSADIHSIYGRTSATLQSLDVLRGKSAAGEWKLRIADLRPRDAGTLLSWSLVIQFAGDAPSQVRPISATRQVIPVVGHITNFTTDVRLLNRTGQEVTATLIFTPDGADGTTNFSAVRVGVPASSVVALPDIVGTTFGTAGIGSLEIDGDVVATSRTYTRRSDGGTFGEAIPPVAGARSGMLFPLLNTSEYRSNIGFAETGGTGGTVRVTVVNSTSGGEEQHNDYVLLPFGHIQVPVTVRNAIVRFESTTEVAAYGSVVNNQTGDAFYVRAATKTFEPGLAPAIHARGAFGTLWVTDLWVSGGGSFTFTDAETRRTATIPLVGGLPEVHYEDILGTFISRGRDTYGVLSANVTFRSAVIRTDGYGQSIEFIEPTSVPRDLAYIESSDNFRTNIGLMSDVASVVRVSVFDSSGRLLALSTHTLAPMDLDQFPVVGPVTDGYVHIAVVSGRVAAYASVIDNRTGDASFVPAR